jgi:hypothetical protein
LAVPVVFASAASAGNVIGRVPPGTVYGQVPCAGPDGVTITYLGGNISFWTLPTGTLKASGHQQVEVTNNLTGKSVVITSDGMGKFVFEADGTLINTSSGSSLWSFYPGDVGPGDQSAGRLFLFVGTQTGVIDPAGATVAFNYSGKIIEDVCAAVS